MGFFNWEQPEEANVSSAPSGQLYDVLIIGAGLSGICSLHHLRKQFPHWRICVLEVGDGPGGTWRFNRYPGARFDSESLSYGFSFDQDILDTWNWKEAFSPQPETLKYIEYVCDRKDLYRDMRFNTAIRAARWQEEKHVWCLEDAEGKTYLTRFLVNCIGFLSKPTLPKIPGVDTFAGQSFHTSRWPSNLSISNDFAGERVGVIGTGATGIQTITALSKEPGITSLTVFQRTANWSAPLRNHPISEEEMMGHRAKYAELFRRCAKTPMCFIHQPDERRSADVSEADRHALWEKLYAEPGFGKWLGTFKDTYTDREANRLYSEFMADKIRARVNDPVVAESLIPKDHGFGTRRVPLESGYFEAYNQPNVHLVDLRKTPISTVEAGAVVTSDGKEHQLDVLIYAMGFDAITGAFKDIDFQGVNGQRLLSSSEEDKPIWPQQRPRTFLGLTVPSMPNFFMILGPHQPFGNAPRSIEHAVHVVSELLHDCDKKGLTRVEPTEAAVEAWSDHVVECSKGALSNEVDSWMTGVNSNVEGKTVRSVARYAGSAVAFRKICDDCRLAGWEGLQFQKLETHPPVEA